MKAPLRFCLCFTIIWLTAVTAKPGETYKISPAQSSVTFSIHHFLGLTRGKFTQLTGTIEFDRAHPERSSIEAVVEVKSIDTGIVKRDEHLRSGGFFDAAKYPQITFKSRSVKQTGPQTGDVLGDLTMHGVTRPITLHVKLLTPLQADNDMSRTRWAVRPDPIKRSDFGLLFSTGAEVISGIGQDVTAEISIEATR
jgi:polyisoprenoid-binding protein YceI